MSIPGSRNRRRDFGSACWRCSEHGAERLASDGGSVRTLLPRRDRLSAVGRYLLATLAGTLLWESAPLPLYSCWRYGRPGGIAFAALPLSAGAFLLPASAPFGA